MAPAHPAESHGPSRARLVPALWLWLTAVLYLDRICMAQAVDPIQRELKLTNSEIRYVLMPFTPAHGLFETPAGRMGDRFGSRTILTRIVIWCSVFTALTGTCSGLFTLLIVRFLFGAGAPGELCGMVPQNPGCLPSPPTAGR
jgi:MFS family permease